MAEETRSQRTARKILEKEEKRKAKAPKAAKAAQDKARQLAAQDQCRALRRTHREERRRLALEEAAKSLSLREQIPVQAARTRLCAFCKGTSRRYFKWLDAGKHATYVSVPCDGCRPEENEKAVTKIKADLTALGVEFTQSTSGWASGVPHGQGKDQKSAPGHTPGDTSRPEPARDGSQGDAEPAGDGSAVRRDALLVPETRVDGTKPSDG